MADKAVLQRARRLADAGAVVRHGAGRQTVVLQKIQCRPTGRVLADAGRGRPEGLNVSIWHGLYAPKGTPAAVLKTLNDALKAALKDPDFVKKQEGLGAVVVNDARVNPAEHKKFVAAEVTKWGAVIKAAGQYAD